MKKLYGALLGLVLVFAASWMLTRAQNTSLEITGVNATKLPEVVLTVNVLDSTGKPISGLTASDFTLGGEFAQFGRIVSVQNVADDALPFAVVLVIDTSSSMSGAPIARALEAARLFVDSIGDSDPVAIMTFDNRVRLVQDYTTDKETLRRAISSIAYGGQTALYAAAAEAAEKAAAAPVNRRAVILLSDGAQFPRRDEARGDGLERAIARNVSFYTIGLGFGSDRTYLQELSEKTNARFFESPAPDQLAGIFSELAAQFRSQYVVTIAGDVPLDGTQYSLALTANTPLGASNTDTTTLRAPVPVPVVVLATDALAQPLSAPVTLTPDIRADDRVRSVTVSVNGTPLVLGANNSFTLDPLDFAPNQAQALQIAVTDADGDVGKFETTFSVVALPTAFAVALPSTPLSDVTTVTVTSSGRVQTPLARVTYTLNGVDVTSDDAANGFPFTIDPFTLPAGEHTLVVNATNGGGVTTSQTATFSVAAQAPRITADAVSGVSEGQLLSAPTTITLTPATQAGATIVSTTLTAGDTTHALPFTLDPFAFAPGNLPLTFGATDSSGQTATFTVNVTIPAIKPLVSLGDFAGGTFAAPFELPITVNSQTPVQTVTVSVGETQFEFKPNADGSLPPITIDPTSLGDGDYTAEVTVTDASGQQETQTVAFSVALPKPTAEVGTPDTTAAQATLEAQAAQATREAQATTNALNILATQSARATQDAQATQSAQATRDAQATADTAVIQARQNAEATQNAQATQDARATQNAIATLTAQPTATFTATATDEPTATLTATATNTPLPTLTPVGEIREAGDAEAPPATPDVLPIVAIGGAVLGLLLLLFLLSRGRKKA